MSSRVLFAAVAAGLPIVVALTTGCASGGKPTGFGKGSSGNTPHTTAAKPLGTYAASAPMTKQYGITEWRTFFGANQMVVTGYKADGTAARGVQFAWFAPAQGAPGHTRLTMLDGSGSVLRRMVGGGESGHLSSEQIAFIQAMRSDVAMGRQPQVRKLHPLDDPAPSYGNSPGQGPQCFEASTDPSTVLDGSGCILGAATFETVVGGLMAMGTCAQWYLDNEKTKMTCANEDASSCNNDNPPTCNFGGTQTQNPPPAPQQQCDQACICANYGVYNGMPCSQTCTDNATCGSGQECHWGSCGPAAAPADSPTNQNVTSQTPGTSSCSSGDVTTDPSTGQVGCSTGSGASSSSSGSSGGASGSSSGTDTTGGDPTSSSSGGASSSGGSGSGSSGGGQCADDGASCSQDADCCLGSCGSGTCGVSSDPGSSSGGSGSSSGGGSCAADGASCAQDSDCCAGTCDTSSGTCGSGSGSGSSSGGSSSGGSGSSSGGSCAPDGSACAQDADCCNGSCDTSTGTCGASSGSSSGGGSGSSSGGSCSADGTACSQPSDCCTGACTSGVCGTGGGGTCGNPGDACAQDSDCCSGSCDTSAGTCN